MKQIKQLIGDLVTPLVIAVLFFTVTYIMDAVIDSDLYQRQIEHYNSSLSYYNETINYEDSIFEATFVDGSESKNSFIQQKINEDTLKIIKACRNFNNELSLRPDFIIDYALTDPIEKTLAICDKYAWLVPPLISK